jgi:signal transduction histidine kinase/DNA-binding response OmpR family regulator/HPt (histidine-containing phosphotransfer) domain-containing protein
MSLRSKIFLLLIAVFGLYALLDYQVQSRLVLPAFKELEDEEAASDIQRCAEALRREEQSLSDALTAMLPQSSVLLKNNNPAEFRAAFGEPQFAAGRMNLLLFADPSGTVLWSGAYDSDQDRPVKLDEYAPGRSVANDPLFKFTNGNLRRGKLKTSAGLMLVASQRVPGFGSVAIGRLLDNESAMKAELQKQAGVQFEIIPLGEKLSNADKAGFNQALARNERDGSQGAYITAGSHGQLKVYKVLTDLNNKPVLLLLAERPRNISQKGYAAVQFAQGSIIVLALFVLGLMLLLMEKLVTSRIGTLSRFCRSVEKISSPGSRVTIDGRDELARLGNDINRMLAELEHSRARLDDALAETRAAAAAKSEFLAVMSHEIRTPMNGVLGMLGVLGNTQLSAEQYEHLSIAQESAENLLRLLNDILDFSKIEAGKLEIEEIDFNLPMLIEDNLRVCALKAREKGLELITDVSGDIPETLIGDPGRIRQILSNLINNAIKFTHEGYVAVVATLEEEQEDHVIVRVNIHDSGIGIPEDRIARLFKSFSQVDASTTRKYGGSGLGLAICSTLAEMMGGQCGVESEMGRGSTFWFTLKLERLTGLRKPRALPLSELKGHSVLIVDDSTINRRVMNLQLSKWGLLVAEADSGRVALEMLRSAAGQGQPYEICILDYIMPGLNGQELGQAILSEPLIGNTRLILVTSAGQRGDANKFHAMGYAAYLSKPISQNQLVECVASVLGMEDEPTKATRPPLITKYSLAESQASSLEILLAEDNRVNQKVALALLGRAGHKVDVVENGRAAVEALKSREYDLVFMDVHMPEMDGFQATQAIRRMSSRMALVPIIAMTARAMQSDRQVCLDSGMDDYLSKPINPVELYAAIDRQRNVFEERTAAWIETQVAREVNEQRKPELTVLSEPAALGDGFLGAPVEKIGVEAAVAPNWDGSVLLPDEPMDIPLSIEHVGDRKFWLELVEVFLGEMPARIDQLRALIEDGDAEEVENLAHSIKGSCAEMLAEPMRQVSQALELCGRERNLVDAPELLDKLIDSYRELEEVLLRERAMVA